MAPPWSRFGKWLHFLKVEPVFSIRSSTHPVDMKMAPPWSRFGSTISFQCTAVDSFCPACLFSPFVTAACHMKVTMIPLTPATPRCKLLELLSQLTIVCRLSSLKGRDSRDSRDKGSKSFQRLFLSTEQLWHVDSRKIGDCHDTVATVCRQQLYKLSGSASEILLRESCYFSCLELKVFIDSSFEILVRLGQQFTMWAIMDGWITMSLVYSTYGQRHNAVGQAIHHLCKIISREKTTFLVVIYSQLIGEQWRANPNPDLDLNPDLATFL